MQKEKPVLELRMGPLHPDEDPALGVPAMVYPYSAGIYGGLLGGLAMTPFAVAYGLLSGNGIWYPVNLIAATLIRDWQQYTPYQISDFNLAGVLIGLAIHFAVATGLGLAFVTLLPTLPGPPLFWAFIVGPILWFGATFGILPLLNPVMARLVDWSSFGLANITYSLVMGIWVARTPKIKAN